MKINYSQAIIDIAEASGYSDCFTGYWDSSKQEYVRHWNYHTVFGTYNHTGLIVKLPNYFCDLNAISDAEQTLSEKDRYELGNILMNAPIGLGFDWGFADAPQRAMAFLIRIKKWNYEQIPSRWVQ